MTEIPEKIITLFGSSNPKEEDFLYKLAFETGAELAKAGWGICNGGYGGTMEASAKGAKSAGGFTLGITCTLFGRSGPNAYLDKIIETYDLYARLTKLIEAGQGYVVFPGGSGTLVELSLVWELIAKKLLSPKPIILLGDFWNPVIETASIERPKAKDFVLCAQSPKDVVRLLG
jgi:uncharacterized protein (TIGR00730 family)